MAGPDGALPRAEFDAIYAKVPRLTVEIVVCDDEGRVYLTRRAIEPCRGQWHLPGGTVRFGEALGAAVERVARRELAIEVVHAVPKGHIEYPSHYLHGLDSPVGLVFEVTEHRGRIMPAADAMDSGWFRVVPGDMHADQDDFLLDNGYLRPSKVS